MTPKEKAQELVYKMKWEGEMSEEECFNDFAKECALIAVDFAKDSKYSFKPMYGGWVSGQQYYEEVKQEINKL